MIDLFYKIRISEAAWLDKVNVSAEKSHQLLTQCEKVIETILLYAAVELHKEINIAGVGVEFIRSSRAENIKLSNMVLPTKLNKPAFIFFYDKSHNVIIVGLKFNLVNTYQSDGK